MLWRRGEEGEGEMRRGSEEREEVKCDIKMKTRRQMRQRWVHRWTRLCGRGWKERYGGRTKEGVEARVSA